MSMNDDTSGNDNHELAEITGDGIPSMLFTMVDGKMLVPTVTVAEMAPIQPFDIIPNTPDWFLGYYPWRNLRIPVLSYETMNMQSSPKIGMNARVAVLNNTGISDRVPFLGVLVQDTPSRVNVDETAIEENLEVEKNPYDLMLVKLGYIDALLPDIEAMEQAVLGLSLVR